MRFKISHLFALVAGVAVALSWFLVPKKQSPETYKWNQRILPYAMGDLPEELDGSNSSPISVTYTAGGFNNFVHYSDGIDLYKTNHLLGWSYACRTFEHNVELQELRPFPQLTFPGEVRTEHKNNIYAAYRDGFFDAKTRLIHLSKRFGSEELRNMISTPTPWYYPNGRPLLYTLLYGFTIIAIIIHSRVRQIKKG